MNRIHIALLVTGAMVGSGWALAEDGGTSSGGKRATWEKAFNKADTDKSGGLSKAELDKTPPKAFPAVKKNFDAMDANKDGQVTMQERDAFVQAMEAKHKKK